jgi:hypothetical protein
MSNKGVYDSESLDYLKNKMKDKKNRPTLFRRLFENSTYSYYYTHPRYANYYYSFKKHFNDMFPFLAYGFSKDKYIAYAHDNMGDSEDSDVVSTGSWFIKGYHDIKHFFATINKYFDYLDKELTKNKNSK